MTDDEKKTTFSTGIVPLSYKKCKHCTGVILRDEKEFYLEGIGFFHDVCVEPYSRDLSGVGDASPKKTINILFVEDSKRESELFDKIRDSKEVYPELAFCVVTRDWKLASEALQSVASPIWDFVLINHHSVFVLEPLIALICKMPIKPKTVVHYGILGSHEKEKFAEFKVRMELENITVKHILLHEMFFSPIREKSYVKEMRKEIIQ